jgi:hypothetical protein
MVAVQRPIIAERKDAVPARPLKNEADAVLDIARVV